MSSEPTLSENSGSLVENSFSAEVVGCGRELSISEGFSSTQPPKGEIVNAEVSSPTKKRWKRLARVRFKGLVDEDVVMTGDKRGLEGDDAVGHHSKKSRGGSRNSVDVSVRSFNCGHIDCVVSDADGRRWRFTGFYGEPKQWLREQSWVLLRRLAGLDNLPWLIRGDFNEILRGDEKEGGLARMGSAMDGFREAVDSCNLLDMGFSGSKFMWCNRQFGGNVIWERLDRCFCNIG
ncbi:hypothetical protein ACOSQ3_017926 [Xanthoceras sorbifolium]